MNKLQNIFLLFICFFVIVALTQDCVSEFGVIEYIGAAFLTSLVFVFLPAKAIIFGVNHLRKYLGKRHN